MLLALIAPLAFSARSLQEEAPAPAFRKLQAKMTIEYCSKNTGSELLPCKEEVFLQTLKGLSKEERQKKISDAVAYIEEKRKKRVALAMHEDVKFIYDEFCAKKKETSEICSNDELKSFVNNPIDLGKYKNQGYSSVYE
ncbi:hypothetical protein AB1Y20_022302 [Prymnesium parvum]|uniref:Uncharacterized protein n=1 Tax=Prymnesium parvum TaxID=97485 RepID=A0AB34JJ75_PRYPA